MRPALLPPVSRRSILVSGPAAVVAGLAPRAAWGSTAYDVVVIGAGLAGLHAAQLLEQAGLKVAVVEAERRIGGRLHTLDDMPGRPEAGGIQIGQGYRILRGIAARLGVALDSDAGAGEGAAADRRQYERKHAGRAVGAISCPRRCLAAGRAGADAERARRIAAIARSNGRGAGRRCAAGRSRAGDPGRCHRGRGYHDTQHDPCSPGALHDPLGRVAQCADCR